MFTMHTKMSGLLATHPCRARRIEELKKYSHELELYTSSEILLAEPIPVSYNTGIRFNEIGEDSYHRFGPMGHHSEGE